MRDGSEILRACKYINGYFYESRTELCNEDRFFDVNYVIALFRLTLFIMSRPVNYRARRQYYPALTYLFISSAVPGAYIARFDFLTSRIRNYCYTDTNRTRFFRTRIFVSNLVRSRPGTLSHLHGPFGSIIYTGLLAFANVSFCRYRFTR